MQSRLLILCCLFALALTANADSSLIKPFKVDVPEEKLEELKQKLSLTRLPQVIKGSKWSAGTDIDVSLLTLESETLRYEKELGNVKVVSVIPTI